MKWSFQVPIDLSALLVRCVATGVSSNLIGVVGQVLENVSVTHFNEDMYLDDTCEFQFHARDSCVCVSATADTDTGCVLVTADGLGVVCWWMFDGDGDGNRAQCLRPVMMSQPCRLPDTRVPHHLTALLRSGDPT